MTSNRKRARRMNIWRRYQNRIDRLAPQAPTGRAHTDDCLYVIKTNPGYFRAEGWSRRTLDQDPSLRHGA